LLSEQPHVGADEERVRRRFEQLEREADKIFVMGADADYEPDPATSIKARAEREGKTLQEVFYDALTGGDGRNMLYLPLINLTNGVLDEQREILALPDTLMSFGDAGAHLAQICDAAYSSYGLLHWGRDRREGLPLERLVRQMTGAQAELFGFEGRGRIAIGAIADINVIDHAALKLEPPEMLYDIPGGGSRLMQCARGYIATLVGGEAIVEGDEVTGAAPGKVLRS
jgi:N-acyl-D-aspartate/D-glutamate deacylase